MLQDPVGRFVVQAVVIIALSRVVGLLARRVKQPMVIAEIVAGIAHLRASSCKLTSVAPLAALSKLEQLYLGDTGLTDISPLYGLTSLKTLEIYGTRVPAEQRAELKAKLPNLTVR